MPNATVPFEVVLRTPGSGHIPTVHSIDQFRPDPENLELVRRWFHVRGAVCHATSFGLACSAAQAVFEGLFGVKVRQVEMALGGTAWEVDGAIRVPLEIASVVEDITLSRTPEFF
jgi:hypothetical protein